MKKWFLIAVALLMSVTPLSAHNDSVDIAHRTTHQIELQTILSDDMCSATAIGKHALLTASHCEAPTDEIEIDGKDAKILALTRDKQDHTIFLVDIEFKDFASFSVEPVQMGDHVFIFGNPGELNDVYREGYLAGKKLLDPLAVLFGSDSPSIDLYDMNGWHGDSGAAIFNSDGKIVGVVTAMAEQHEDEDKKETSSMRLIAALPLAFTAKQLQDAAAF